MPLPEYRGVVMIGHIVFFFVFYSTPSKAAKPLRCRGLLRVKESEKMLLRRTWFKRHKMAIDFVLEFLKIIVDSSFKTED